MRDSSTGSTGNTDRPSRRTVLAASAGLTTSLALNPTPTEAAPGDRNDKRLRALISRMTLEGKVGQLFVMRVYGHSATAPDQADIDANLKETGVRTAAELLAKYRVGGIIYFAWAQPPVFPSSPSPSAIRTTCPNSPVCAPAWRRTPGRTSNCGRRRGWWRGAWRRVGGCRCRYSGRTIRRRCCIRSGTG